MAFGAVEIGLDCHHGAESVHFTFSGHDEMTEVSGDGEADLEPDEQRDGTKGSKAKRRPRYYFANNFHVTTSGHLHTKPFLEAIDQIGADRMMFSVVYPYEQMDMGGRLFDDMRLDDALKFQIGRENANKLFKLGRPPLSRAAAAGFGS